MTCMTRATAFVIGLCIASAAGAKPAASARQEIDYLLQYVAQSNCKFNRNGTWYDAKTAHDHVRMKYEFLLAQDRIDTTEDFIKKAATRSSVFLGQPYTVKCDDGPPMRADAWLNAALAHLRSPRP